MFSGENSMSGKRKLDDDDFPVKPEGETIKSRDDEQIATTENAQVAEDLADRLNDDALRRHEDNWSA
jgi:hypothetical protein